MVAIFLVAPSTAFAHSPHDVIQAIAVSPDYLSDGTIFTIVRENLLRSSDCGRSWVRLTWGLRAGRLHDLAISPRFGRDGLLLLATREDGLFRSRDRGNTWECLPAQFAPDSIRFSRPEDASSARSAIFVREDHGILWSSFDAGESWSQASDELGSVAGFSTQLPGRVVVVADQQLCVSIDDGRSWRHIPHRERLPEITCLLPLETSNHARVLLGTRSGLCIFDSRSSGLQSALKGRHITSLAAVGDGGALASTWAEGVFGSDDAGATWNDRSANLTRDPQADTSHPPRPHFKQIVAAGRDGDSAVFLAGFDGLFHSSDLGCSWREFHHVLSIGLIVGLAVSPETPNGHEVAVTTYGAGVYTSPGDTEDWRIGNHGLEMAETRLFDVEYSPAYAQDHTVFALSNRALLESSDGGRHWQRHPLSGTDGASAGGRAGLRERFEASARSLATRLSGPMVGRLHKAYRYLLGRVEMRTPIGFGGQLWISPSFAADSTIYVSASGGFLRSTNAGRSFHAGPVLDGERPRSLVFSPQFECDDTIFAAHEGGVFRSTDAGVSWSRLSIPSGVRCHCLAISPGFEEDGRVFCGGSGGLIRSDDRGDHWRLQPVSHDNSEIEIRQLSLSPDFAVDGELLIATWGCGLFRSSDHGDSFVEIAGPHDGVATSCVQMTAFPDGAPLIHHAPGYASNGVVYASNSQHLFVSRDRARTWNKLERPVRYEDLRPEIYFEGDWRLVRGEGFSASSQKQSTRPGDSVSMHFVGRSARWIGSRGPDHGTACVHVDGARVADLDLYHGVRRESVELWRSLDLDFDDHFVRIEVTDERTPGRGGRAVAVDAIDIFA